MSFFSPLRGNLSYTFSDFNFSISNFEQSSTQESKDQFRVLVSNKRTNKCFDLSLISEKSAELSKNLDGKRVKVCKHKVEHIIDEKCLVSERVDLEQTTACYHIESLIQFFCDWDDLSEFSDSSNKLIFDALEQLAKEPKIDNKKSFAIRIKNSLLYKRDLDLDIGLYDWQSYFSSSKNFINIKIVLDDVLGVLNTIKSRDLASSVSCAVAIHDVDKTPERMKRAIEVIASGDFKWTPKRTELVRDGFVSLSELDSETKRAELITRARQDLVGSLSLDSVISVEKINGHLKDPSEKTSVALVLNLSNKEALSISSPMSPRFMRGMRFEHIEKPHRGEGWHFSNDKDPKYSMIKEKITNMENGVWVGKFGKKAKFSSFFPKEISSLSSCVKISQDTEVCMSFEFGEKRKTLRRYSSEGKEFYFFEVEQMSRVITMYPMFYAKYYKDIPDKLEIITDKGLMFSKEKKKILKTIQSLSEKEKKEKILITTKDNYHLVDISMMEGLSLEKSVAIFLSSEELEYEPIWE
jgi:hypothetical protein